MPYPEIDVALNNTCSTRRCKIAKKYISEQKVIAKKAFAISHLFRHCLHLNHKSLRRINKILVSDSDFSQGAFFFSLCIACTLFRIIFCKKIFTCLVTFFKETNIGLPSLWNSAKIHLGIALLSNPNKCSF